MNRTSISCVAVLIVVWSVATSAAQGSPKPAPRVDEQQDVNRGEGESDRSQEPAGLSAVEQEWRDAADAWRRSDADAQAVAAEANPCSADIESGFSEALSAARTMLDQKRAYYDRILDWYGRRYTSASNLIVDYQPQIAVLEKQLEALRAERSDLQRRSRALRGERTEAARGTLEELVIHKAEQIGNIEEALTEFEAAKGNVQQERRVAADARAKIVEILRTVQSEQELFDAYYRNQRSSANLRCTKSEPILKNFSVRPRGKGGY